MFFVCVSFIIFDVALFVYLGLTTKQWNPFAEDVEHTCFAISFRDEAHEFKSGNNSSGDKWDAMSMCIWPRTENGLLPRLMDGIKIHHH